MWARGHEGTALGTAHDLVYPLFLTCTALGLSRYSWYYAPLMPALIVLAAEGAVKAFRLLARTKLLQEATVGMMVLLLTALLAPLLSGVLSIGWQRDPQLDVYRDYGY